MSQMFARLQLMVAQGVAKMIGADKVQVTVLDGETLDNVRRVEPFGLSYRPLPGAQAYVMFPSGDRSYGVAVVIGDKRYQLDLAPGEAALHDHEGNYVAIKNGGKVKIKASAEVDIEAPSLKHNGVNIGADHYHIEQGDGQPVSGAK